MNSKQRSKDKKLKALVHMGRQAATIEAANQHLTTIATDLQRQLDTKEGLLTAFRQQVKEVSSSSQELTHELHATQEKHEHEVGSIQELLATATSTIEDLKRRNDILRTANKALHREAEEATEVHARQFVAATRELTRQVEQLKKRLIEPDKLRRRLATKSTEIEKLMDLISDYRFKLGLPPDEYHPFTRQVVRGAQQAQALAETEVQSLPIDDDGRLLPDANDAAAAFAHASAFLEHVKPTTSEVPYQFEKIEGPIRGIPVDGVVLDEAQTFSMPQSED